MSMTRVRDPQTQTPIVCAWDDCEKLGWDEVQVVVTDPGATKSVTYLFCCDRHRDYWRWSSKRNGDLPPGTKLRVR